MVYKNFGLAICTHLGVEVAGSGVFSEVTRLHEGVKVKRGFLRERKRGYRGRDGRLFNFPG